MNMDDVRRALQTSPLADHGLLTPGEHADVLRALEQLSQRNLHAYVVVLPRTEDVQAGRQLWTLLGLRDAHALLLLYNGRRWEARGWGLDPSAIGRVLKQAEQALRQSAGAGLIEALTRLATEAAPPLRTRQSAPRALGPEQALARGGAAHLRLWVGGGALVLVGAMGWVLYRRRRLQQEQTRTLQEPCDEAEAAFTQVMLVDAALDTAIRDLQLQATVHKQLLEALMASVAQGQRSAGDPVLLGEVRELTNQFATLHSAILRRQKEHGLC